MNLQLIKQISAIIQRFPNRTHRNILVTWNLTRIIHTNFPALNPRFTRNIQETDQEEVVEKPVNESKNFPIEENLKSRIKSEASLKHQSDISKWNEIEKEMFMLKKPGNAELPKIKFKGNKAFIGSKHKSQNLFDMEEIDDHSDLNFKEHKKKAVKKVVRLPQEATDPDIGNYLNLDRDDPLIDKIFMAVHSKKQKTGERKLLLEGRRLITEALLAGLKLETLVFSKIEQVKLLQVTLKSTKAKLVKVANHNLKLWSQLTTSPGIMGIFEKPEDLNAMIEAKQKHRMPISIVCDNIREPSNLGAVIRVAAACGIEQIILMKGCTNPWELKCIRSSSGAHFRVKIIESVDWMQLRDHLPSNFDYYIADNQSNENLQTINYDSFNFQTPTCADHKVLVIGGEAHGISKEAKVILQEKLTHFPDSGACVQIDIAKGVDSLNVASALAVVLFEMRRKLKEVKQLN